MTLQYDNDSFSAHWQDQIAVIRFKKHLLQHLTELADKEALIQCLEEAGKDDGVRAILILGSEDKIPVRGALDFFHELIEDRKNEQRLSRVFNALDQLVLTLKSIPKFIVHGDGGDIPSTFFNISLACDYRIISEQTRLTFASAELGLLLKGGGVYYLREKAGPAKTAEILLSGASLDAASALELGLVEQVAPGGAVEQAAMDMALKIAEKPLDLTMGAKKLINCPASNLPAFLKFENTVLMEIIYSRRFKRRLEKEISG